MVQADWRRARACWILALLAALSWTARLPGGEGEQAAPPILPGAVTEPPDWIGKDAPIDVAAFFAAPPTDQNAAVLYLDALFEFSPRLAVCFHAGPEREKRLRAVQERWQKLSPMLQALRKDPTSVTGEMIDAVLAPFDEGFRKLAQAQEPPRCVFQTGLGVTALYPHLDGISSFRTVAVLRIRREREQGNLNRCLHELGRLLRVGRDILPRGGQYAILAWTAVVRPAVEEVVVPLLAHPDFTVAHCDRLLALLAEHESQCRDVDAGLLRAEHLFSRATLRDLVRHQDQTRAVLKARGWDLKSSLTAAVAEPQMTLLAGNGPFPQPTALDQLKNLAARLTSLHQTQDLDARMARMTPEELDGQERKIDAFYRRELEQAALFSNARLRRTAKPDPAIDAPDLFTRVTRGIIDAPSLRNSMEIIACDKAMLRDALALVAIRHWQLRHADALPSSLAEACRDAGMPAVPADPYDGKPLRMTLINGQTVVYCLGKDGRDDRGQRAALRAHNDGDVLLRMPAVAVPVQPAVPGPAAQGDTAAHGK